MKGFEYVEVVLYAYPHLNGLAEGQEQSAENRALLSYRARGDAFALMADIVESYRVGRELRKLKGEIARLLADLDGEALFLLEHKYFRRPKVLREKYGERPVFHGCLRSYYRRQRALLCDLAMRFAAIGLTEQTFLARFGGYAPFLRARAKLQRGKAGCDGSRVKLTYQKSVASSRGADLPRSRRTATPTTATQPMQIATMWTADNPPPL